MEPSLIVKSYGGARSGLPQLDVVPLHFVERASLISLQ